MHPLIPFLIPLFTNAAFIILVAFNKKFFDVGYIFLFQGLPFIAIGFITSYYGNIATINLKSKNLELYKKYLNKFGTGKIEHNSYSLLTKIEKETINKHLLNNIHLFYNFYRSIFFTFFLIGITWITIMFLHGD